MDTLNTTDEIRLNPTDHRDSGGYATIDQPGGNTLSPSGSQPNRHNPGLQQRLLQVVAKCDSLSDVGRELAAAVYPSLDAAQIWYCQRDSVTGQIQLERLLELETAALLEESLHDLMHQVERIADSVLQSGTDHQRKIRSNLSLQAVPVFYGNQRPAALVALCLSASPTADSNTSKVVTSPSPLSLLQLVAIHLTLFQTQHAHPPADPSLTGLLCSNLNEIISSSGRTEACSLLCTRLAGFFGANQMALFATPSAGRVQLAGLSGTTDWDRSGAAYESLQAVALHFAQQPQLKSPISSDESGVLPTLLKQAAGCLNQSYGLAIPIKSQRQHPNVAMLFGGDSLRSKIRESAFANRWATIEDQLECALHWHDSPMRRTWEKTKSLVRRNRRWVAAASVGLALISLFPMPYRMNCECELSATEKRYVVAPYAGSLERVAIDPGQTVRADQVLAKMDDRDLKTELRGRQSEFDRELQKSHAARAAGKLADARISELESQRISQEIKLIRHRLENQELRSPIDGTVIQGDLRKLEGAPVEQGQELFEVAPLSQLIVEIAIPEYQYRYAKIGQTVTIRLEAYPFDSWSGTIKRLKPAAETRNGRNVFVAEVEIANRNELLRPGMKGNVIVQGDRYPLAWNWLHYPYEKVRSWLRWY